MLFNYKALTPAGESSKGEIEAISVDVAIGVLQKKGLVITEITAPEENKFSLSVLPFFNRVSHKDVVILSRQMATLFAAQISALRVFRLISSQVENAAL